jgi:hypothetical protein
MSLNQEQQQRRRSGSFLYPPISTHQMSTQTDTSTTLVHQSTQFELIRGDSKTYEKEIKGIVKNLRNEFIQLLIKIFQAKHKLLKLYLVILILFVSSICGYTLADSIMSYLEFNVITTSRSITETVSNFPKVTFCNKNIFQTSYALEFLSQVNKDLNPEWSIFVEEDLKDKKFYQINDLALHINRISLDLVNSLNFTDKQRKLLAHEPRDFVVDCQYGDNYFCLADDKHFVWHFDRYYGNLFTYPPDRNIFFMNFFLRK